MTTSAFEALDSYINATSVADLEGRANTNGFATALRMAYDHATEYSLPAPGVATGQLISSLVAIASLSTNEKPQAIAISPSAVVGLYILTGLPDSAILSCIDPEAEHQALAKKTFREAGYPANRVRFLPSRALDVINRMAADTYQFIFAEVPSIETLQLLKAAWPLLRSGGTIMVNNSLLDGTLGDASRTDRATVAAREFDAFVRELSDATVTRLPLESGITLITRR